MVKILIILLVVGVIVAILSALFGGEDPVAAGCMASAGCGYGIVQILLTVGIIALCIMFVGWLFS